MEAEHHGGAALELLDDVDLPQRTVRIERLRGEVGNKAFERLLASSSRQARALHVIGEAGSRIVAPIDGGRGELDLWRKRGYGSSPLTS